MNEGAAQGSASEGRGRQVKRHSNVDVGSMQGNQEVLLFETSFLDANMFGLSKSPAEKL